jgi:hypothetical protein
MSNPAATPEPPPVKGKQKVFDLKIGTSKDQPEEHRTVIFYSGDIFDIGHFNKKYQHFDGLIFKEETPLDCVDYWIYFPGNIELQKAMETV